jgi:hypothetical protein
MPNKKISGFLLNLQGESVKGQVGATKKYTDSAQNLP